MKRAFLAAATAALFAADAYAAIMIVGTGPAADCYEAARMQRRDRGALETCSSALENQFLIGPDRAATLVNRGIIYLRRGQNEAALADFDAALELQPDLSEAHTTRGAALLALRDYPAAVQALTRAIELDPSNARAHFYRAGAYEEMGDARSAYHDYRRAAELAPGWRSPQIELARFQVRSR